MAVGSGGRQPRFWRGMLRSSGFWYAFPSFLVLLAGLATCSFVDVEDVDRFVVEGSVEHPAGRRSAVIVRHTHADSGSTVKCVWIVAGPAPALGSTRRLADRCVLVATDVGFPLVLRWQANGRLSAILPQGTGVSASDSLDQRCYFERETLGRHVCHHPEQIDVMVAQ